MALKITFNTTEIHDYLRVEPGQEDSLIKAFLSATVIEAENYMNNDFHSYDDEGNLLAENEAPATVKEWVKSRIVQLYEGRGQSVKPDYTLLKSHRISSFRG